MSMLVAVRPVLYLSKQYRAGDELPTSDSAMVTAWVNAGTAVWKEEAAAAATKAKPAAAKAGMPGKSSSGDPDDLAGEVPARAKRSRKKKAE